MACQHPLVSNSLEPAALPITPLVIRPPEAQEVVAGTPYALTSSGVPANCFPGMVLFGRYQIRREIGRGGFSVVYLAEDVQAGHRLVVIKRVSLREISPRQMIDATETCNRETRFLSHLKAIDGVPTFYGSFTDSENWYLIVEYIEGQTLEDELHATSGGSLTEHDAAEIGQKLACILRNVHARNVIVRDVKPANIMRTPQGKLYLIDFGIARSITPGQKRDTTPLGSPGYTPPEQYGTAQTDARADIYGLGATLQTLLTGRDPQRWGRSTPAKGSRFPQKRKDSGEA